MHGLETTYKQPGDENLLPHFYIKEISVTTGESYDMHKIDYVKIKQIGSGKVLIDRKVKEEDKLRFEDYWLRFRDNKEQVADGHAIIDLPTITPQELKMCKGAGINTIEQVAGLIDTNIKHLGMNGRRLVNCAKKYLLEHTDVTAEIFKEKDAIIAELKKEIEELKSNQPIRTRKKKVLDESINDNTEGSPSDKLV